MNKSEFKERYGSLAVLSVLVLVGCILMSVLYTAFTSQDENKTYAEMERIIEYVKNQCIRYDDVSSESQTKSLISIVDKARNIRREYVKTEQKDELSLKEFVEDQRITGVLIKSDLNSDTCEYYATDDKDASFWNESIEKFSSVALVEEKSYSQRITAGEYYYDYAIISDGNGGIILCYLAQLVSSADGTLLNVSTLLDGFDISDMTIIVTNGVSVVASNDSSYENRPISDFEAITNINEFDETNKLEKVVLEDASVYFGDKGAVKSFFVYTFLGREQVYKDGSVKMAYFLVVYIGLAVCIMVAYNMIDNAKKKQKAKGEEEYRKNLDRLAAEAIRANEAKNDFLRRMSHDIRTPINGIQGIVRIGDYYADDIEKQKECRQKVLKASGYLLELVNDVLDMSKLDQNQVTWTEENFDISEVVDDIANMFLTQASEHSVTLEYEKHVKNTRLYGGAVPLKRICANIIGNAIKYNKPNGKINFTLTETASDDEKVSFSIICADTGIGMSEEFVKVMYEPFAQENPNENSRGGTGLGLAIVKKTVDLLGGEIFVESKKGEGTKFTINLTFSRGKESENKADEKGGLLTAKKLAGLTALLVEDNDLNAEIAQFILETNGAKVINAANGKEGVDKFASSKEGEISFVLMDVMMPVMDGISATRAIRSLDRLDADIVPIIAMTANTYQDDIERSLAAGMNAFVAKPVDAAKLVETILKATHKG